MRTLLAYAHGHLTRHYSRTTTTCQDRRKPRWNQDPRNSSIRPALSLSKYPRSHPPETLLHSPRKGRQSVRTIRCPAPKAKAGGILDLPLDPFCVTSPANTKSWSLPHDGCAPLGSPRSSPPALVSRSDRSGQGPRQRDTTLPWPDRQDRQDS